MQITSGRAGPWVCQEVGVTMYKMFAFFLVLFTQHSQTPHFENMRGMTDEPWSQIYIANFVQYAILYIFQTYQ